MQSLLVEPVHSLQELLHFLQLNSKSGNCPGLQES